MMKPMPHTELMADRAASPSVGPNSMSATPRRRVKSIHAIAAANGGVINGTMTSTSTHPARRMGVQERKNASGAAKRVAKKTTRTESQTVLRMTRSISGRTRLSRADSSPR